MEENHHILYTADENYFPHMLTSIYSLLENNKSSNFMIHIIGSGYTKIEDKALDDVINLYPNSNIQVYDIQKISSYMKEFNLPKWKGVNMANARLFFQEVMPPVSKVLYLDCDTTIVGSLEELFLKELSTPVSAVKEPSIPQHIKDGSNLTSYYNGGVLVFNPYFFEKERCLEKIYQFMQHNKIELVYADQDVLNLALSEEIQPISMKYNVNPMIYQLKRYATTTKKIYKKYPNIYEDFYPLNDILKELEDPCILHNLEYYSSRVWQQNSVHPFNKAYDKYRLMWDGNYKKDPNPNLITHLCFVPFLNAFVKAHSSKNVHDKIKNLVKRKCNMK